ncbi:MAG: hypothetical protein HKO59_09665 [Phycisphaerales bacterium]|nr:hypothetical protein [Phycisphaerae bacterium]NNF41856.1 hypothetical protein [Phycisphaerales bacterium]NNM26230.1 hypothetical protein [Phycisphaerales bacterium]
MRLAQRTILGTLAVAAIAGAAAVAAPPAVPATPAPIDRVVAAQPFVLDDAFRFEWREEKPDARAGYLIVIKVNPDLVYPRQTLEPVLYVGNQVAQRVNVGYRSGHVVAIVPAPLDENGVVQLDLAKTPIWFGTPELPERINAHAIEVELSVARAAGITPRPAAEVRAALAATAGRTTAFRDAHRLVQSAAELIRVYSPEEQDLVEGLLVPLVTPE